MVNAGLTIAGVILAGGLSRRMGVDKAFVELHGKAMLSHVVDTVQGQVDSLVINSNSEDIRYTSYGYPIIKDSLSGHLGPLAGILAGMENAKGADAIFTTPVDCPLLPNNLVDILMQHLGDNVDIVRVRSNGRHHPVIALWRVSLLGALRVALVEDGIRKVDDFTKDYSIVDVDFDTKDYDVFFNINRQDDINTYNTFNIKNK